MGFGPVVRVQQFNVLADGLAALRPDLGKFSRQNRSVLDFEVRKLNLLKEMEQYGADIITLQEVDHFHDFFQPQLEALGYAGYFAPKPTSACLEVSDRSDGCALFVKRSRLRVVSCETKTLALSIAKLTSSGELEEEAVGSNIQAQNQVALIAVLEFVQNATALRVEAEAEEAAAAAAAAAASAAGGGGSGGGQAQGAEQCQGQGQGEGQGQAQARGSDYRWYYPDLPASSFSSSFGGPRTVQYSAANPPPLLISTVHLKAAKTAVGERYRQKGILQVLNDLTRIAKSLGRAGRPPVVLLSGDFNAIPELRGGRGSASLAGAGGGGGWGGSWGSGGARAGVGAGAGASSWGPLSFASASAPASSPSLTSPPSDGAYAPLTYRAAKLHSLGLRSVYNDDLPLSLVPSAVVGVGSGSGSGSGVGAGGAVGAGDGDRSSGNRGSGNSGSGSGSSSSSSGGGGRAGAGRVGELYSTWKARTLLGLGDGQTLSTREAEVRRCIDYIFYVPFRRGLPYKSFAEAEGSLGGSVVATSSVQVVLSLLLRSAVYLFGAVIPSTAIVSSGLSAPEKLQVVLLSALGLAVFELFSEGSIFRPEISDVEVIEGIDYEAALSKNPPELYLGSAGRVIASGTDKGKQLVKSVKTLSKQLQTLPQFGNPGMQALGVLDLLTEEQVGPELLPNANYPSDHVSFVADLQVLWQNGP